MNGLRTLCLTAMSWMRTHSLYWPYEKKYTAAGPRGFARAQLLAPPDGGEDPGHLHNIKRAYSLINNRTPRTQCHP